MWKRVPALALLALATGGAFAAAPLQPRADDASPAEYDYVIVGGGPAGFVLAEQLSRNAKKSVILLEAGPDTAGVEDIDTPIYAPTLINTPFTWNYTCQPDPNLNGLAPYLHQGRGFGGGSAVNYMGACRGAPSVFDEWANISGDDGLRWENFLNDYKATVHFKNVKLDYDPHVNLSAYGDGPLELSAPDDRLNLVSNVIQSFASMLNIPWVDVNDGHGIGVATSTNAIRTSNHTRDFAPQAFGWLLAGRPNAQQLFNAEVTKMGFNGKRAVNITYVNPTNNQVTTLKSKEIILAAGAIGSPKLLMLSGIGPASRLQSLGIPVVADIPQVGQNLYDHHFGYMEFEVTQNIETYWQVTQNATFKAIAEQEYRDHGRGPLGVVAGPPFALSRVPDSVFQAVNDTFHPSLPADRGQLIWQFSSGALSAAPNVSIISPFVALSQPQASGNMTIASSNYKDLPIINPNYYGSPGDKAAIQWAYKQVRSLVHNQYLGPSVVKEIYPGANVTSDEDLWNALIKSSQTFHHPVGTVALGTVVGGKTWRVKGLDGLRVVDSSTFPFLPTCHPMATVYAYAHHAAQLISQQDG